MLKQRHVRSVVLVAALLFIRCAQAADVPVRYTIDAEVLKGAVSGTSLTFGLYTDAGCATLAASQSKTVDNVFITPLKLFKPKGGVKPPKAAEIRTTLTGTPAVSPIYLKVTGTGIAPIGGACQVQQAGAGSSLIAFARVDNAGATVTSFGGSGTTGANVDVSSSGDVQMHFTGNYPAGITTDKLTVLTSCEEPNFAVSDSSVSSASVTEIHIEIFCWKSSNLSYVSNDQFVAVLMAP